VFTVPTGTLIPFPIPIGETWHAIFVDELRRQPPPSFEEMRPGIEQQLVGLAYTTAVEELRNAADVVIVDETPAVDPLTPAEALAPAAPAEGVVPIEPDEALAPVEPAAPADGAAIDAAGEEVAMIAGDAAIGAGVAGACLGCHTIGEGEPNGFGPNLFAILDRPVGGVADFTYSAALATLNTEGAVWTAEMLDAFLANPQEAVPGTTMPFGGFADETIRANLIAYLATLTATPVE
jgi:cytochrome c